MITVEKLESLNSKDLQKEATKLGVKGSKSYTKSDLLALCITLITPTEAGDNEDLEDEISEEEIEMSKEDRTISADEDVFYEDEISEEERLDSIAEMTDESVEEGELYVESINGEKRALSTFPSSLVYNDKDFYQLYPRVAQRTESFKVIREFISKKKSKVTVLNPKGEVILEGSNSSKMFLQTLKISKESTEFVNLPVTIYFDVLIKLPNYLGKAY